MAAATEMLQLRRDRRRGKDVAGGQGGGRSSGGGSGGGEEEGVRVMVVRRRRRRGKAGRKLVLEVGPVVVLGMLVRRVVRPGMRLVV